MYCMYVCMYDHHIEQCMDQTGMVASPARSQLNRENEKDQPAILLVVS